MEELLKEKLEAAITIRDFTKEIMSISLKLDYDKFNSKIDERQKHIENLDVINKKIIESTGLNFIESDEIKALKKQIREVIKEVEAMDNTIRKNLQSELSTLKTNLNQEQKTSKSLNIKA